MGAQDICLRLNADGIPAPSIARGGAARGWWAETARFILNNPVYVGRAAYGRRKGTGRARVPRSEEEWLTAAVPALVTPEEAEAAHEATAHRRRAHPARKPEDNEHELRGLLICGHCGGQIACRSNPERPRGYRCMRSMPYAAARQHSALCMLPMLRGEWVEATIWKRIAAFLLNPDQLQTGLDAARHEHASATGRRTERLDTIDREVARLRGKLARITSE